MTTTGGKARVVKDSERFVIVRGVRGAEQFWSKKRRQWISPGIGGMTFRNVSKFGRLADARRQANFANQLYP